jgi:hypothetical protein
MSRCENISMSKYDELGHYLSRQKAARVQLSFAEIEKITGGKLPASKRYPAWWSNNPKNNPMTQVWLNAGFRSEQVDISARKLVFRKGAASSAGDAAPQAAGNAAKRTNIGEHPLFERIRGTAHVPEGVDLTEPADPDWGELAYGSDADKARA